MYRLDAQQTATDLEILRQKHADLVSQHKATMQCAEEASATAVALRAELDGCQADLAAACRDADSSNTAAEELRKTVVALRQELNEHREKDVEVIARIQDAKEASDKVTSHLVCSPMMPAVHLCCSLMSQHDLNQPPCNHTCKYDQLDTADRCYMTRALAAFGCVPHAYAVCSISWHSKHLRSERANSKRR